MGVGEITAGNHWGKSILKVGPITCETRVKQNIEVLLVLLSRKVEI